MSKVRVVADKNGNIIGQSTNNPEYGYIKEWLDNCDESYISRIREVIAINSNAWSLPSSKVSCTSCGTSNDIEMDLDHANFFGIA